MNRFTKQLPALLSRTDVVLELRDSRLPLTSINHNLESESEAPFLPPRLSTGRYLHREMNISSLFKDPLTLPYTTLVSPSWLAA